MGLRPVFKKISVSSDPNHLLIPTVLLPQRSVGHHLELWVRDAVDAAAWSRAEIAGRISWIRERSAGIAQEMPGVPVNL
jgi:hypothetical protein